MTQVSRKGFVDKNGQQVVIVPNVPGATSGNFASLDGEGNLQDSGKNPADFAPPSGSTEYAAINHNHNNDYAAKTHSHFLSNVTGLSEYLETLSARVSALEDAVIPPSWETVEEIILGVPGTEGQNRYSSGDNALLNLTHFNEYTIGERIRLVGITNSMTVVEGEVLSKSNGPSRIFVSIDLSSITNNGYHYNLQKIAASNNE